MAYATLTKHGRPFESRSHAVVACPGTTTRARLALRRTSSFGSLLAFLLIDFARYFFDQGDS